MKKVISCLLLTIFVLTGCQNTPQKEGNAPTPPPEPTKAINPIVSFKSGHSDLEVVYSLMADINGDFTVDTFVVTGKTDPQLWYIDNTGKESIIIDGTGTEYQSTEVLDRGDQKHIALMGNYPPSNTQLWVVGFENKTPKEVFSSMADIEVKIVYTGFEMLWKKYKDEGGYTVASDRYLWDEGTQSYQKA